MQYFRVFIAELPENSPPEDIMIECHQSQVEEAQLLLLINFNMTPPVSGKADFIG